MTRIWRQLRNRPVLWTVLLAIVLRLPTLTTRLFDADEAAIGVQAMVVRDGGTLYHDIFDRKPPLPPLAYAASFGITDNTDIRLMRVLVTILLALGGALMAREAKRRWGTNTHALWAGSLFVAGAMALFPADAGGANYAHFALLPGTAALLWSRRDRCGWALVAGVALGLAILTRQSWLLAVPPALYSTWRAGGWRHALLLLAGTVGTVLTVGFYAPLGAYWEWNVTNSPGFVFAAAGVGASVVRGAASAAGFIAFHAAASVGIWVALRRRPPWRPAGAAERDVWLWLLCGLAAVAAGLRFFGHYWLQVLPPLVVLATPVAAAWTGRARRAAIGASLLAAGVAWALLFVPGSFHSRPDPTDLADFVRANTTSEQRVFVWGSYPEVLVRADRSPAGALVHSDFVTGRSGGREDPRTTIESAAPGALELMMSDLRARPPTLVLDTSTAADLGYGNYPMSLFPDVQDFVTRGYERVGEVDGVTIWRRRA